MKQQSARRVREPAPDDSDTPAPDAARGLRALLASATADQLAELIAEANNALPEDDARKIRQDDVRMLRRLAGQARIFGQSLLNHAAERRLVGERRGRVSPEAENTAHWADRLAGALETVTSATARSGSPATVTDQAPEAGTPDKNEFLAGQTRNFRDSDGSAWRVRIEQGGGTADLAADAAPVPILILHSLDSDTTHDLSVTADVGRWDLASYSDGRLRRLLAKARAQRTDSHGE